jgi:hypothetical protein
MHVWKAGARVGNYDNTAPQRATTGSEYLCSGWCNNDCSALLQVAVAVGQAEDCTAFLAAAAGISYGVILNVSAAVQRVPNRTGAGRQLERICVEQQAGRIGH